MRRLEIARPGTNDAHADESFADGTGTGFAGGRGSAQYLRPTLTVTNGTSNQAGARTYEFQISDRADFALIAGAAASTFVVVATKTGVAEGSDGKTSYAVEQELQPTTRFYWRARVAQGTTTSAWSAARSFNSKLVGFNRAGELYDPLIHGETIGTRIGATTFIGIRIDDMNSYVRYQLPQTIAGGEFSVEVEGLRPNGPSGKLRVFSMMDGTGNLFNSKFLFNVQYRGVEGNPDNAFRVGNRPRPASLGSALDSK